MPKRQSNTTRVEGGPQGSDAYVVIKRLTLDEQHEFGLLFGDVQNKSVDEQTAAVGEALSQLIFEWNLVDNDDHPLPQPAHNPGIFGKLYNTELEWLINAVSGTADDQKKDLKTSLTT